MKATSIAGTLSAFSSIMSAYGAYEAGQMRQLAYNNDAAMAELNAKQVEIDATMTINERMHELSKTLALQNVLAAATGRAGGSVGNLQQTSLSNFRRDKEKIKVGSNVRKTQYMMQSRMARASGKSAAAMGLLNTEISLFGGAADVSQYL
jgi:hypothetical protein